VNGTGPPRPSDFGGAVVVWVATGLDGDGVGEGDNDGDGVGDTLGEGAGGALLGPMVLTLR
jgi:hypothetical protein